MIPQDELLIGAILQEIEDLKLNLNRLNNRISNLEKNYQEINELVRFILK
ncbi:MAG: hypothetical protein ACUVQ0_04195 [Thermoproteota archaeon]